MGEENEKDVVEGEKANVSCFTNLKNMLTDKKNEKIVIRVMALVLLIVGIVEYVADMAENYIIAGKSKTDFSIVAYSGSILDIFSQIFTLLNTGVVSIVIVRETAASDGLSKKSRQNVVKVMQFGIALSLVCGIFVALVVVLLRPQLFALLNQSAYADPSASYLYITAPFLPIDYVANVLGSVILGLLKIKQILVISLVTNTVYITSLFLLVNYMERTMYAVSLASNINVIITIIAYVGMLLSKEFRQEYDIFTLEAWRSPKKVVDVDEAETENLLSHTDAVDDNDDNCDDASAAVNAEIDAKNNAKKESGGLLKHLGLASILILVKNLAGTANDITEDLLVVSKLSQDQFYAYNVVDNVVEFTSFISFATTVITIFGPRYYAKKDWAAFRLLFIKMIVQTAILAVLSYAIIIIFNSPHVSLINIAPAGDVDAVSSLLKWVWPIWAVNLTVKMCAEVYTSYLVSIEKYALTCVIGIVVSLIIQLPMKLVSVLVFDSLMGFYISGLVGNLLTFGIGAYYMHFMFAPLLRADAKSVSISEKPNIQ